MKNTVKPAPARTVDEYLAALPVDVRIALEKLRHTIRTAAPKAEEVISYQIPSYKYKGPLVHFAAFAKHCSLFGVSRPMLETFKKELKDHKISGTTIHFTPGNPLPAAVVKKMVKMRVKQNEKLAAAKAPTKTSAAKTKKTADPVEAYMNELSHPLKKEIEAVRTIIRRSSKSISERIKWNAPSYYYKEDMVTFNPRATGHVHLVFHHPGIVKIKSALLHGDYKDRRMAYFKDMKEVKAGKKELERIMNELVKQQDK